MKNKVLVNTYRLLEEIGRGGFGSVHRAVRLGSEGSGSIAIKFLHRNPNLNAKDYLRFQREATLMSQLSHPGVVAVYELGEEGQSYFIVMEYVAGKSLREHVKSRGGQLPLLEIIEILIQCADALDYVHTHRIIHRDIKPQNILIAQNQENDQSKYQIKLVDFGVASLSSLEDQQPTGSNNGDTTENGAIGTYAYMSPEATGGTEFLLDHRADIYSLGVVAYELLAGRTPFFEFKGEQLIHAHLHQPPPPLGKIAGRELAQVLDSLVMRCLAKSPSDRYQSMFALSCDLKRMQADLRANGQIQSFTLGTKDYGIGQLLNTLFIGHQKSFQEIIERIQTQPIQSRVSWIEIEGEVGSGKTRFIEELRKELISKQIRYVFIKFSESEQRLPYQALGLAINDYLAFLEQNFTEDYNNFIKTISKKYSEYTDFFAHFIPALRIVNNGSIAKHSEHFNQEFMKDDIHQKWNQLFLEFLLIFVEQQQQKIIFLIDDLHLADKASLSLFQHISEKFNQKSQFSFLFSHKNNYPKRNKNIENLISSIQTLKHRNKKWQLLPFNEETIVHYLKTIGVAETTPQFIDFIRSKTQGSPMLLSLLIKQMLAENILAPGKTIEQRNEEFTELHVDWERLVRMDLNVVNVEVLLSSLAELDPRDLEILRIAAIVNEAVNFELFRIDPDFTIEEVSIRLTNFVNKKIFNIIGDEDLPISRKAFLFTHEKIRSAVLSAIPAEEQGRLHHLMALRILSLHANPRKEQWLNLARHCDGAGNRITADIASTAFVRAVQIYANAFQYNLADYYIRKGISKIQEIEDNDLKLQLLRSAYDIQYTIYAAQGNLVTASQVCKRLIDITPEPGKRLLLQTFWGQLLLSLGRYQTSYEALYQVCSAIRLTPEAFWEEKLAQAYWVSIGTPLEKPIEHLIPSKQGLNPQGFEICVQAATLLCLGALHSETGSLTKSIYSVLRLLSPNKPIHLRWATLFKGIQATLYMRQGKIAQAYFMLESGELELKHAGMGDGLRWLTALKAIWLDYPLGRMERLAHLFQGNNQDNLLPVSGLMYLETQGLKAWLHLITPSSMVRSQTKGYKGKKRKNIAREFSLIEENSSLQKTIEGSDNSQFIALGLFSEAFRAAMSDKIEPLRRANEQFKKHNHSSDIGKVFAYYSLSLQYLISGQQQKAFEHYQQGNNILRNAKFEILALCVSDGLRFATLILPFIAFSFQCTGWIWGESLFKILNSIEKNLRNGEGTSNPRRNVFPILYAGMWEFLKGDRTRCFTLLENAIKEARHQHTELIECIAITALGTFCAQTRAEKRAVEHLHQALQLAKQRDWRLFERQIQGIADRHKISLPIPAASEFYNDTFTERSKTKYPSKLFNSFLLKLYFMEFDKDFDKAIELSTQLVAQLAHASRAVFYKLQNTAEKSQINFLKSAEFSFAEDSGTDRTELDFIKMLSTRYDTFIKLIPLNGAQESDTGTPNAFSGGGEATVALGAPSHQDKTMFSTTAAASDHDQKQPSQPKYALSIATPWNGKALGWWLVQSNNPDNFQNLPQEENITLMAQHLGYLMGSYQNLLGQKSQFKYPIDNQNTPLIPPLPGDVLFEWIQPFSENPNSNENWILIPIQKHRFLVARWQIQNENDRVELKTSQILKHHLEFFSASLQQKTTSTSMEQIMARLSHDLTFFFQNNGKVSRFKSLHCSFMLWDSRERRALEGIFGKELFVFSGQQQIENEFLQDFSGVLRHDRLVYREHVRIPIGASGWFFVDQNMSTKALDDLNNRDFLSKYLDDRIDRGAHLSTLFNNEQQENLYGFALMLPKLL